MAIIIELKIDQKQKGRLWVHETPILEVIFVTLICRNKWYLGTSDISTPPEIAVVTHFHARHGTKTTSVFLPADGEVSWLLLPSSVFLLSGTTVQLENIYSCILKVTCQVWESQKRAAGFFNMCLKESCFPDDWEGLIDGPCI